MQASVTRPTVFVSSTIYDFVDLRDAVKFWLEEMGFEVQMSEHTDFERRPEAGAFEACFESIRASDYYVLLIGRRRGQWYQGSDRVSVTRKEYRIARQSFDSIGKPRIISTVRSDAVVVLKERERLGATGGDSLLEDPQFTAEFIREVRGDDAVAEGAQEPNWLAPFRDFRELIAILRTTLGIRGPLPRVALLEAVHRDCEHNLRVLLSNHRGHPFWNSWWLSRVRKDVVLTADDLRDLQAAVSLTFEHMTHVIAFLVACIPAPDRFVRVALDQVVRSVALLEYDRSANRFVSTPLLDAIYGLREELDRYARCTPLHRTEQEALLASWAQARTLRRDVQVRAFALFVLFGVHDTIQNIGRLSLAILRYIYGHTDSLDVRLRPSSPVDRFAEDIRRETVSEEQLRKWLEADDLFLRVGAWEETEAEKERREAMQKRARELLGDEVFEQLMSEASDALMGGLKAQNEDPEVED
jgi:hypothetical protein